MVRAHRATFGALALLAAGTTVVLADTQMGVLGDTECDTLVDRWFDGMAVCDEAVDHRLPWVLAAAAIAVACTITAVILGRRTPASGRPAGRPALMVGAVVVGAGLALGWWGAHRLGEGSDDYCGSPITGAGSYPYNDSKPQDCADAYDHDRLVGLLALGGGAVLTVTPAGVAAVTRRRMRVSTG